MSMEQFYALQNGGKSPHLAYVIGVLLGDGCCYRMKETPHPRTGKPSFSWRIELAVKDQPFAQAFAHSIGCILRRPDSKHRDVKILLTNRVSQKYRVCMASKSFGEWWQGIKDNPEAIKAVIGVNPRQFLRGLYDSEGNLCWSKTGPLVRIFNQRQEILDLAIFCLVLLGMRAHIRIFRQAGTVVRFPNGTKYTTSKALYVIDPKPARQFIAEIGSNIPKKIAIESNPYHK